MQEGPDVFPGGDGLTTDSTRLLSMRSLDRAATASSLAETPMAAGVGAHADGRHDRTPGESPRAGSDMQDVGGSLLRRSRNDLRAAR